MSVYRLPPLAAPSFDFPLPKGRRRHSPGQWSLPLTAFSNPGAGREPSPYVR
jgi:hypothetical protein